MVSYLLLISSLFAWNQRRRPPILFEEIKIFHAVVDVDVVVVVVVLLVMFISLSLLIPSQSREVAVGPLASYH